MVDKVLRRPVLMSNSLIWPDMSTTVKVVDFFFCYALNLHDLQGTSHFPLCLSLHLGTTGVYEHSSHGMCWGLWSLVLPEGCRCTCPQQFASGLDHIFRFDLLRQFHRGPCPRSAGCCEGNEKGGWGWWEHYPLHSSEDHWMYDWLCRWHYRRNYGVGIYPVCCAGRGLLRRLLGHVSRCYWWANLIHTFCSMISPPNTSCAFWLQMFFLFAPWLLQVMCFAPESGLQYGFTLALMQW